MSYIRWCIDLAVQEPVERELEEEMDALVVRLRSFREQCVNINEGLENEEDTRKLKRHICHHDTGGVCEPEEDL